MSDLDPKLQTLFTVEDISDDGFSDTLMNQLAQEQKLATISKLGYLIVFLILAIVASVQFGVTEFITLTLTAPIVSLGESWIAWVVSPVNNAGALLILLYNLFRRINRRRNEWRVSLLPF